jgi:hypothetical protein
MEGTAIATAQNSGEFVTWLLSTHTVAEFGATLCPEPYYQVGPLQGRASDNRQSSHFVAYQIW